MVCQATSLLTRFTQSAGGTYRNAIVQAGWFPAVAAVLKRRFRDAACFISAEVAGSLVEVLATLADSEARCDAIAAAGCLPPLVQLLNRYGNSAAVI